MTLGIPSRASRSIRGRAAIRTLAVVLFVGILACGGGGGGVPGTGGSGAGALAFSYGSQSFTARSPVWFFWTASMGSIQVEGSDSQNQQILMQFPTPSSVPTSFPMDGFSEYGELRLLLPADGFMHTWYACDSSGSVQITLSDTRRLVGTFSFRAVQNKPGDCGTPAEIAVTGGAFDLQRDVSREP